MIPRNDPRDGDDQVITPDLPRSIRARLNPTERYGVRLTLVGLAIALVAIPFATLTFQVLDDGPLTRFDGGIANHLNSWVHRNESVLPILEGLSWLGRPPLLAVWVAITALWCWRSERRRLAVFVIATSLGGGIVDTIVKMAVNRPRPVVDHPVSTALGKSFPSGHSMSATVVYGAIALLLLPAAARRWRPWLLGFTVLLVLAIGTSRLFLGVHFLTDVIGGYLLGLAWLAGAAAVFQAWRHDLAPDAPVEEDEIGLTHHEPAV
ncbi:MAG: phosphatase PAP2 family protein [Aquihabitans sp.]